MFKTLIFKINITLASIVSFVAGFTSIKITETSGVTSNDEILILICLFLTLVLIGTNIFYFFKGRKEAREDREDMYERIRNITEETFSPRNNRIFPKVVEDEFKDSTDIINELKYLIGER